MIEVSKRYAYIKRADLVLEAPKPALTDRTYLEARMADDDVSSVYLTFKYRLLPTKKQHRALERVLEEQRLLYNAALEERHGCYRATGKTLTYIDQCKELTQWRQSEEFARSFPLNVQRWTLRRVDDAYKSFFRRVKERKGKAGFPRFRGKGRWNSFGFNEFEGIRFDGKRLRFSPLRGSIRVHLHRPMPAGTPRACAFIRDSKGWHVSFQMRIPCQPTRPVRSLVGADVGLSSLVALSNGDMIPNPRHAKRIERELRVRQRALSRCKMGSKRRLKVRHGVTAAMRRVANARATYLHQVSADLVKRFDLIAIEKLNVRGLATSMLAKSVHDAAWGRLRQFLAYKAERAGSALIEVDPRYTSQTCPECGQVAAKKLSQRIHECDCGCVLDRDVAAARVILSKAVAGLEGLKTADCRISAPVNIACGRAAISRTTEG